MSDIVASSKRKINLFDRVIQSVVIMVNMSKMNRAIDEHLAVIRKTENEEKRVYQENILREIVFVKYQYDIMQREMYELKLSYREDIIKNINSSDKVERLELQKEFLEMEYDRITKARFKSREDVKFSLLAISSAIDAVKQNIKDEGKSQRYNNVIKLCEDVDTKIQTEEYDEELYKSLFSLVDEYVGYINDNYDISKLPSDERELIEYVIETMIKGIESDIDRHMYEFNLIVNICKNAYRYFKIIDKIFFKLQNIYDESLEKDIITIKDYAKMYNEIYSVMIKTKVNDVHRTITTEDEYLEYSKIAAGEDKEALDKFILNRALNSTENNNIKEIITCNLEKNNIDQINEELILNELKQQENEKINDEENVKVDVVDNKDNKKCKTKSSKTKSKTVLKGRPGRPKLKKEKAV